MITAGKLYFIKNSSTEDSLRQLSRLFTSGQVKSDDIKSAHIKYDCDVGVGPMGSTRYYPLTLKGDRVEIHISCVTAGYRGNGPHGTIEALRVAGFDVTEEIEKTIFTRKHIDRYFWKKEGVN